MKPGDVRSFKHGVVVAVGVWTPKKSGNTIQIRITCAGGKGTITTVADGGTKRCHPHLFRQLRKLLVDNGCWLYGENSPSKPADCRPDVH
jgi:hypothetical protein